MGAMILLYIGWVAALISMIILLIIYVVFILIDLRFSEWVK
jgi:hypothetical protein